MKETHIDHRFSPARRNFCWHRPHLQINPQIHAQKWRELLSQKTEAKGFDLTDKMMIPGTDIVSLFTDRQQIHKTSGPSEILHPSVFIAISFFFWVDQESIELWGLCFWRVNFKVLGHLSEITAKLQRNNPTVNQKSERETSHKDYKGRKKQMAWRVDYNTSSLPRQWRNWYQMLLGALSLPWAGPAELWRGPMQYYLSIWDKCAALGRSESWVKEISTTNYYFIWMMKLEADSL